MKIENICNDSIVFIFPNLFIKTKKMPINKDFIKFCRNSKKYNKFCNIRVEDTEELNEHFFADCCVMANEI